MEGRINKNDKYAIYGMNRVSRGFLYVFDDLIISRIYDDAPNCEEWNGFPVSDIQSYAKESGKLILCGYNKSEKEETLNALGLRYETDYFCEEDFFFLLDDGVSIPHNKEIVVWGTGQMAKIFMEKGKKFSVSCFLDSYAQKDEFYGRKVVLPDKIKSWNEIFVIIAAVDDREIRNYLLDKHLEEGKDFTSYRNVMYDYSHMMKETLFSEEVYDFSCNTCSITWRWPWVERRFAVVLPFWMRRWEAFWKKEFLGYGVPLCIRYCVCLHKTELIPFVKEICVHTL